MRPRLNLKFINQFFVRLFQDIPNKPVEHIVAILEISRR